MTREQLVTAEAIKMADAHRMAESLRSQSHDEGNARIRSEVHAPRQSVGADGLEPPTPCL